MPAGPDRSYRLLMRPARNVLALLVLALAVLGLPALTAGPASAVGGASLTRGVIGFGSVDYATGTSSPCTNTSDRSGITCPAVDPSGHQTCTTTTYPDGSTQLCSVTVTASPAGGWAFLGWSGDCTGTTTTCTLPTSERDCDTSGFKPLCTTDYATTAAVAHFVDVRPPTLTITSGPAQNGVAYSDTGGQQFSYVADDDDLASVQCTLDGAPSSCGTSYASYSSLGDGVHDVCFTGKDTSGNVGPATCRRWEQETPLGLTFADHAATVTQSGPDHVGFTSNKDAHPADGSTVSFTCSLDGAAPSPCTTVGYDVPGLANGPHHLVVQMAFHGTLMAPDEVGTLTRQLDWTQDDSTAPSLTASGPNGILTPGTRPVSWVTNDPTATFGCSLDGAAATPCSSPTSIPRLADGVHHYRVTASDAAGNTSLWTFDWDQQVTPTVVVDSGPASGGSVGGATTSFTFHSANAHTSFRCSLDAGAYAPCNRTGGEVLSNLSAGRHSLRVLPRYLSPLGMHRDGAVVTRSWTTVLKPTCITQPSPRIVGGYATLRVTCSQAGTATTVGSLRITPPGQLTRTVATYATRGTALVANRVTTVKVQLTSSQLGALAKHWPVRGSFTVRATNLGGTGSAHTPWTTQTL